VLSGRGLCDGPIPRPEESYRLWCVSECDREASIMKRPWPPRGCCAIGKKSVLRNVGNHLIRNITATSYPALHSPHNSRSIFGFLWTQHALLKHPHLNFPPPSPRQRTVMAVTWPTPASCFARAWQDSGSRPAQWRGAVLTQNTELRTAYEHRKHVTNINS
jgi:hypothetical protein